jgi:hypothetical protein
MIPPEHLVSYIEELYGHETAHLDCEEQIDIALQLARAFNNIASELLKERDEERRADNSGAGQ